MAIQVHKQKRDAGRSGLLRSVRRAGVLVPVLLVIAVVLVAATSWSVANWRKAAMSEEKIDWHRVSERTFMVELKEKGELKAAKSVDIKCEVEGRSTIISVVDEGTAVEEGDLLVELASDQLQDKITQEELKEATTYTSFEAAKTDLEVQRDKNNSDIAKAELQVQLKTLELEKYTEGEWLQAKRDAEIAIEEAELKLERSREDFVAAQQLLDKGFITQIEFEEDEFNFQKADWDLEKAQQAIRVLEKYTHIADLKKRESDLEEAKRELERVRKNAASEDARKQRNLEGKEKELAITRARLQKLRDQKEKCLIYAPAKGFVVYYGGGGRFWSSDGSGQVKEGATVHERQVMMQLPDTSEMIVTVRIHEAKTNKIRLGQPVFVEVEGVPDKQFSGSVTKIAAVADTQNRWLNPDLKEYETEITLDDVSGGLKPGVTAHARILVEEVMDAVAVPVQSVYSKGGKRFVFKRAGQDVQPHEIQLGSIGSEWASIVGGVDKGDQILLAFSEEETRMIPDVPAGPRRSFPGGMRGPGKRGGRPGGDAKQQAVKDVKGGQKVGTGKATIEPGQPTKGKKKDYRADRKPKAPAKRISTEG
ncbi:MAG: efflux RND transporter periplasmic adaptor subunit [Planctomycetota bacterium]